ncbi:MAG TPA: outer membrane lipoprotein-sorting protein [Gammaproteobacteria bacterium]|nr:outer membrane lipoprotein-sorting protein [Gammaproteobacteria bacterium]
MRLSPRLRPLPLALCAAVFTLVLARPAGAAETRPDPARIVARADHIRFPPEGFQVNVTITSTSPGYDPDVRRYQILSKGNDRTLVMTTYPPIDRGQTLLMRDKDLWVFMPNVSQPIRLPLSQRLTGQVANGDLARANFTGDYTAKLLRTDTIDGRPYYVLELTAVNRSVTYHRVLYWVDKANYRPYKAEFFTLSGRKLKICRYEDYRTLAGRKRPTRLVMRDALRQGRQSVMTYSHMRLRNLPDKYFSKDYLKKLQ